MSDKDDFSPPQNPNFLKKQLERTRFERAVEVAYSLVDKHAFLNSAELARINNIIRGQTDDPWREGATVCFLPSGHRLDLQVMSDPIKKGREILNSAKERAAAGEVIDAAADLYSELVLTHVFKDANRRTAVVAAAYLLKAYGYEISANGLHELGLGDLRVEGQRSALRDFIKNLVKIRPIRG